MKHFKQHIKYLLVLSSLAFIISYSLFKPRPKVIAQKKSDPRAGFVKKIDLQGHRGSRGLKPENTWPSFARAIELGMTTVELDLNITADKKLIVYHDSFLNHRLCRAKDGSRVSRTPIRNITVAELKELDCGLAQKKFPEQEAIANTQLITLNEFFKKIKDFEKVNQKARHVRFNLEIKIKRDAFTYTEISEMAKLLVNNMIKNKVINRSSVQSFSLTVLAAIKKIAPGIETGTLFAMKPFRNLYREKKIGQVNAYMIRKTLQLKSTSLNVQKTLLNEELVSLAHKNDLKIYVWTVNEPYEIAELLARNVDGIITDYPNRLSYTYNMWQKVNSFQPGMVKSGEELRIPAELIKKHIPRGPEARNLFRQMVAWVIERPLETIRIVE